MVLFDYRTDRVGALQEEALGDVDREGGGVIEREALARGRGLSERDALARGRGPRGLELGRQRGLVAALGRRRSRGGKRLGGRDAVARAALSAYTRVGSEDVEAGRAHGVRERGAESVHVPGDERGLCAEQRGRQRRVLRKRRP